jgi:hypothetical protein
LLVLIRDRRRSGQLLLGIVVPFVFGALVGVALGNSAAACCALSGLAVIGAVLALSTRPEEAVPAGEFSVVLCLPPAFDCARDHGSRSPGRESRSPRALRGPVKHRCGQRDSARRQELGGRPKCLHTTVCLVSPLNPPSLPPLKRSHPQCRCDGRIDQKRREGTQRDLCGLRTRGARSPPPSAPGSG